MKHYSHVTRYHAFPDSEGAWGRQIASRSSLRSHLLSTGRQTLTSLKQDGLKPNKRLHKIDFPSCCLLSLSCSLFFLLRLSRNWVERNVQPRGEWGSEEQCPRSSSSSLSLKREKTGPASSLSKFWNAQGKADSKSSTTLPPVEILNQATFLFTTLRLYFPWHVCVKEIEITCSWIVCAYGFYSRVVKYQNERARLCERVLWHETTSE